MPFPICSFVSGAVQLQESINVYCCYVSALGFLRAKILFLFFFVLISFDCHITIAEVLVS